MVIEVELLRAKGLPQSEDDPNPCTTQVRVSVLSSDLSTVLCAEQCSSVQENSNAPFFKDTLSFTVDEDAGANTDTHQAVILVKVFEFSRRSEPFVMLYGALPIALAELRSRKEAMIPLREEDPLVTRLPLATGSADASAATDAPCLSVRLQAHKTRREAAGPSLDADVQVAEGAAVLRSDTQIVPERCEYVWMRLLLDHKWTEGFRYALCAVWRTRPPLGTTASSSASTAAVSAAGAPSMASRAGTSKRQSHASVAGAKRPSAAATASAPEADVKSLGDVILRKWCCRRLYQIVTRVRLTAEKFSRGNTSLLFTTEEEMEQRTEKKTRAQVLAGMCMDTLEASSTSALHDWLERCWVLFAVGIDNDPAGSKTLSYDVRRRVHEAAFAEDDAVILQAALVHFLLPSVPFEACQSMAEEEARAAMAAASSSPSARPVTSPKWDVRVTQAQRDFTAALVAVVGPFMETLTETELCKALRAFKPAVQDAFQRIAKGGKQGIQSRLQLPRGDSVYIPKGEGVKIKHLDKLGRRKDAVKFA